MKPQIFTLFAGTAALAITAAPTPAFACSGCGCSATKAEKNTKLIADHGTDHKHGAATHTHNIVETAQAAGQFSTLLAAATTAGLDKTLAEDGPFTVFAPTDAAFARLPQDDLNQLLMPENRQKLTDLLLYHVVPGKVLAKQAAQLDNATTASGDVVTITIDDKHVKIDGANIVKTDVLASNGVIHVIDRVLMPLPNIVETAKSAGAFNTLLAAAKAAGIAEKLAEGGPYTVFAPTDDAFAKLPAGTVESLLKPENKEKLTSILKYHVVKGYMPAAKVTTKNSLDTEAGQKLAVTVSDSGAMVGNANIVQTDVRAGNGMIHVIDAVLIPGTDSQARINR